MVNVYKILAGILGFILLNYILGKYIWVPIVIVILLVLSRWIADLYWNHKDKGEW